MRYLDNAKAILDDFASLLRRRSPGAQPSRIEAAIYFEDCFDIVLSDEEIASLDPEDPDSLGRLLAARTKP